MKNRTSKDIGSAASSVRLADRNPIAGTPGDDVIPGTDGDDLIDGGSGDDTLEGRGGDDILSGGKGSDALSGGDGDDWLDGGGGTDLLDGGDGSDTVDYSANTTSVNVYLSSQQTRFPGTNWPSETLVSIENAVTGSGDDTLIGNEADNRLEGGDGNDTFWADSGGHDIYQGGSGSDTLKIDLYSMASFNSGLGLEFYGDIGVRIDLTESHKNITFTGLAIGFDDSVPKGSAYDVENVEVDFGTNTLIGNGAANTLSGGGGADSLYGGKGADKLFGNDGDDFLSGGGGTDYIDGGDGSDFADYSDNTVDIEADLAAAKVSFIGKKWQPEILISIEGVGTGSGNDVLKGTETANVLRGGSGSDLLRGYGGNDILDGGLGQDRLYGGSGTDTADFSTVGEDVLANLGKGFARSLDSSKLRHDLYSIENLSGGSGDDFLYGNGGANVLDGGGGDDSLYGRQGDDTFLVSSGEDLFAGGGGIDTVLFDLFFDAVHSKTEYTFVDGDRYIIEDFSTDLDASIQINLENQTLAHSLLGGGSARLRSIENVKLVNAFSDDTVIGSDADNKIWVGGGANYVFAGDGDDIVYGGAWNADRISVSRYDSIQLDRPSSLEELIGGRGDDIIYGSGTMIGGSGNDTLHATSWDYGSNTMRGGSGADTFSFSGASGNHDVYWSVGFPMRGLVKDFDPSEGDKIMIRDVLSRSEYFEIGDPESVGENTGFSWGGYSLRDGEDTIVIYTLPEDTYYDYFGGDELEDMGLAIRLENYTGPVTEDMFILA